MADLTVYAWGYGDAMVNALRGVSYLFAHDGTFYGLAKVVSLFGFIAVFLAYLSARGLADPLRLVRFYVVWIGVASLFFGLTTNVQVHDKVLNQTYVVQRVPYPVAWVLSFITQVEDAVSRTVDTAFSVAVPKCGSQGLSIFGCSQVLASAMDVRVVDPYLQMNLSNFYQDCIFTSILDGTLNAQTLERSQNLYHLIFNPAYLHPSRLTSFVDENGTRTIDCVSASSELSLALSNWVSRDGMSLLASAVGISTLSDVLGTVPSSILRVSSTGTNFLMQSVLINQFKETYKNWASAQGIGITEAGLFVKGQLDKASAQRYLPVLNGVLHVMFASLSPVLVLFMLTPLMGKAMLMILTMGLWLIVWRFAEGVVNGFYYSKIDGQFVNFASSSDWGLNALYAPVISQALLDHQAIAGSLYWLVPTLSFMIASLGGYAFHTFAGSVGSAVQAQTASAGADITRGSFNAGVVNYRTVSSGNMQFGNFSGWTTSSGMHTVGAMTSRGGIVSAGGDSWKSAYIKKTDSVGQSVLDFLKINGAVGNAEFHNGKLLSFSGVISKDGKSYQVSYDGSGTLTISHESLGKVQFKFDENGLVAVDKYEASSAGLQYISSFAEQYQKNVQTVQEFSKAISEAKTALEQKDYGTAVQKLTQALTIANSSEFFQTSKGRELVETMTKALEQAIIEGIQSGKIKGIRVDDAKGNGFYFDFGGFGRVGLGLGKGGGQESEGGGGGGGGGVQGGGGGGGGRRAKEEGMFDRISGFIRGLLNIASGGVQIRGGYQDKTELVFTVSDAGQLQELLNAQENFGRKFSTNYNEKTSATKGEQHTVSKVGSEGTSYTESASSRTSALDSLSAVDQWSKKYMSSLGLSQTEGRVLSHTTNPLVGLLNYHLQKAGGDVFKALSEVNKLVQDRQALETALQEIFGLRGLTTEEKRQIQEARNITNSVEETMDKKKRELENTLEGVKTEADRRIKEGEEEAKQKPPAEEVIRNSDPSKVIQLPKEWSQLQLLLNQKSQRYPTYDSMRQAVEDFYNRTEAELKKKEPFTFSSLFKQGAENVPKLGKFFLNVPRSGDRDIPKIDIHP